MFLVSSCLVGLHTRYDGGTRVLEPLVDLVRAGLALPICPEQLGGMPTPRPPAEIQRGTGFDVLAGKTRVLTRGGEDVTAFFCTGAQQVLSLANLIPRPVAILKARSPSCGNSSIYDGSFQGISWPGPGITAALLLQHGIPVFSEKDLECPLLFPTLFSIAKKRPGL